jgi:HEAT repeat protein
VTLRRKASPTERLQALRALPRSTESSSILVQAALDPSPDVAIAAVRLLASLGGPAEAAALREHLLGVDLAVVPSLATALRLLGDRRAVEVACAGLRDGSPTARTAAALALRELRDDAAAPALRTALGDDQAGVRRPVLDALAALRSTVANEEACAALLGDPDDGVRIAAVRAVSVLAADPEARMRRTLHDPSPRVRRELARRCASFTAETVGALLRDADAGVRAEAAWALVADPRGELVPLLIARLEDESWHVRRAACRALGAAGDERARRGLVRLLLDPNATVRATAKWALSDVFGDRLAATLVEEIDGADPALRQALVYAIGDTRDRRAADRVGELASDPGPGVRLAVVHVLPTLAPERCSPVLERLCADSDPDVRHAASSLLESNANARA